jgi:hypothetical protein
VSAQYNDCSILFDINAKSFESTNVLNESGEFNTSNIASFQQASAQYNDCSISFDINAKRFESTNVLNKSGEFNTSKINNHLSININVNRANDSSLNRLSTSLNKSSPYNNPYAKLTQTHHSLYKLCQNNFDAADSGYDDRLSRYHGVKERIFNNNPNQYNENNDEDVYDFDYADAFDDVLIRHEHLNPSVISLTH